MYSNIGFTIEQSTSDSSVVLSEGNALIAGRKGKYLCMWFIQPEHSIIFITDQGTGDNPDLLSDHNSTASDNPDLPVDSSTTPAGDSSELLRHHSIQTDFSKGMILVNSLHIIKTTERADADSNGERLYDYFKITV